MDITCAVFDDKGQTTAQAHHAPMLLTGFELTMKELVKYFDPADLEAGDVIISNDPYMGGQHIMDVQTFSPVHYGKMLVGFVGTIAHQSDMGGMVPGGVAGGMTEIYQEGIILPPVKFVKKGKIDKEIAGTSVDADKDLRRARLGLIHLPHLEPGMPPHTGTSEGFAGPSLKV